jgi:hypothetical protein
VLTVNPQIIESPNEVHIGFESVNGIIHKAVQIEVSITGSSLDIPASIMASLKGIFSAKL